jgi:hypothetical protein
MYAHTAQQLKKNQLVEMGLEAQTYNIPLLRRQRQADHKFETSLGLKLI